MMLLPTERKVAILIGKAEKPRKDTDAARIAENQCPAALPRHEAQPLHVLYAMRLMPFLEKRDALRVRIMKRQNEHEERLSALEARPPAPVAKKPRPARISGTSLIAFRKRVGISQRQLAVLMETTPARVCSWEKDLQRSSPQHKRKFIELREKSKKEIAAIIEASKGNKQ